MRSRRALLIAGFVLAALPLRAGPPTLTPASVSVSLSPGETHVEDKRLDFPAIGTLPVDVVLHIDSTGSMQPAIDQLKAALGQIVSRLGADYGDLRMGLVEMRDHSGTFDSRPACSYNNLYGGSGDNCLRSVTPLTADLSPTGPLVGAVNNLLAGGGGDFPECHGAVLQQLADDPLNTIGWRPGSFRLVVLLTDTSAHDCDFCAIRPGGCPNDLTNPSAPGNGGVDPGLDGLIQDGTYPRDAPILPTIDHLAATGLQAPIKLATIFARTLDVSDPRYSDEIGTPIDPTKPPGVWRLLTQRTAGDARCVDKDGIPPGGTDLAAFVESLILDVNATCQAVTADVSDPTYASWIQVAGMPVPHTLAAPLKPAATLAFRVQITPPAATPPGTYAFALATFCDGHFLARQTIEVMVKGCTSSAPDVTANSLRAVHASPAAFARFTWGSSGGGGWNLHATADKTALPLLWSDMNRVVASYVTATTASDPGSFPAGLFQVFAADVCTRNSVP